VKYFTSGRDAGSKGGEPASKSAWRLKSCASGRVAGVIDFNQDQRCLCPSVCNARCLCIWAVTLATRPGLSEALETRRLEMRMRVFSGK